MATEFIPSCPLEYSLLPLLGNGVWNICCLQGVFAIDLTLAEVKQLHAKQSMAYRDQAHNRLYSIPTLQEYIDIALSANRTYAPQHLHRKEATTTIGTILNAGCP